MSSLKNLTPINLAEEKEKFFSDQTYNPQFRYAENVDKDYLVKYGKPLEHHVATAHEIVDKAYFGRNEQDLRMLQGKVLSKAEVTQKFESFLALHDLDKRFKIVWSSSYLSRTSISHDTIHFRNGAEFRKESLLGTLYHEIGTHALRRINYEKQPWYRKKKKYGFKNYLHTEEGLAILHSLLPKKFKSAYSSALRYVAVDYAQHHSFSELWHYMGKYIQDPQRRWNITIRQKRGLEDTAQPGGFTKDLTYFEGTLEVAHWLDSHQYNIRPLYFGKLAYEDIDKALEMNPAYEPILPSFYQVDPDEYSTQMHSIAEYNELLTTA